MRQNVASILLVGTIVMSLLSGCGSQAKQTTQTAGAGEKQEIDIWYYWENEQHQEILAKELDKFNNSQEEIVAKAKYVPFADFKKQLSIGATYSELPDIAIIDGPDHASYAAMGIFADLTGKIDTEQYYEGAMTSCMLDGKVYGGPFGSKCLGLYYNEDMLKQANVEVPTTWDELRSVAKALTKGQVSGLAFCSLQNEEGTFNFSPWL